MGGTAPRETAVVTNAFGRYWPANPATTTMFFSNGFIAAGSCPNFLGLLETEKKIQKTLGPV